MGEYIRLGPLSLDLTVNLGVIVIDSFGLDGSQTK